MPDHPHLRFIYLTFPEYDKPTLNITVGNEHFRYTVTRDQLFDFNEQIADTLIRKRLGDKHEQLVLSLEKVTKQPG